MPEDLRKLTHLRQTCEILQSGEATADDYDELLQWAIAQLDALLADADKKEPAG